MMFVQSYSSILSGSHGGVTVELSKKKVFSTSDICLLSQSLIFTFCSSKSQWKADTGFPALKLNY